MNETLKVILLTTAAGAAMPIGGWIAMAEHVRPRWLETELRHAVIAFGGGALLAAVALVLVPEGIASVPVAVGAGALLAGGMVFMGIDIALARSDSPAANLTAMLADFLPEAIALGAVCSEPSGAALLLAMLIGMQNLPEGFNAYRELKGTGMGGRRVLAFMAALVALGPIAGLIGLRLLADHAAIVGGIMLFAAGGILYLMFQDIAPQAKLQRKWAPPLGAVLGFLLGLVGQQLVH